MDIVTIIQARMSSSRLPGKVLMPMGDGAVLDQVIKRSVPFSRQVVVCTSVDRTDDVIEEFCSDRRVICTRGPLDDVFMRFRQALQDPRVEGTAWFARVTADCPLLSTRLARLVIGRLDAAHDYASVPPDRLPRGLTAEFVNTATFMKLDPAELDGPQREHVTLALYEHRERYRCLFLDPPPEYRHPEFRFTLDYAEDYQLLTALFARDAEVSAEEAISWLGGSARLRAINAHCVQKAARPAAPSRPPGD